MFVDFSGSEVCGKVKFQHSMPNLDEGDISDRGDWAEKQSLRQDGILTYTDVPAKLCRVQTPAEKNGFISL
jgi:hypothetical protein